jgi:hypothetical protein
MISPYDTIRQRLGALYDEVGIPSEERHLFGDPLTPKQFEDLLVMLKQIATENQQCWDEKNPSLAAHIDQGVKARNEPDLSSHLRRLVDAYRETIRGLKTKIPLNAQISLQSKMRQLTAQFARYQIDVRSLETGS